MEAEDKMKVSLRRSEVELTGKPFYTDYQSVPKGLYSKTQCSKMKEPVKKDEEPVAYVLNRLWLGYLPLYKRKKE